MTKFKTAKGQLTVYGFACGYVDSVRTETLNKEIYMEHSHYHVRSTINQSPELHSKFEGPTSHAFTIWETFSHNELTQARKLYNKIK